MAINDDIAAMRREIENLKSIIKSQRQELRAELLYAFKIEVDNLKHAKDDLKLFERNLHLKIDNHQRESDKRLADLYRNIEYLKQDLRARKDIDPALVNNIRVLADYLMQKERTNQSRYL
jgi:hypothetical protein